MKLDLASLVTMVLAALLAAIPVLFMYNDIPVAFWSDILIGLAVFVLALGRNLGWGAWTSWVTLFLGLYLLILPYAAGFFTYSTSLETIGAVAASFVNPAIGLAIAWLSAWDLFAVEKPEAEVAVFTSAEPRDRD